jgi:DNA helicase-2/ATP-dependent DNA helicase PcrA
MMPKLMDDSDGVALFDEILHGSDWEHIRPRSDSTRYFKDLKNLISLLKREQLLPSEFSKLVEKEIQAIQSDPESISSRGASKGQLKKDAESKIERLTHTIEAIKFYEVYEKVKEERGLFDYDDVLRALVKVTEQSEDAANFLREQYLYVLVDEHQDSSGVQNRFLESVWGRVEKPNIFVVGDDRQLIYGFGGASLQYFENFKHAFGKAKLVNLVDNYRSTQMILDTAHALLQSSMSEEKLKSNQEGSHPIRLVEADYLRDEIIICGLTIKRLVEEKRLLLDDAAVLVPNNRLARQAARELQSLGLPVASGGKVHLFDLKETESLIRILKIIAHPGDSMSLAESLLDPLSGIPPLEAHKFMIENNMRSFDLIQSDILDLEDKSAIKLWLLKLRGWVIEAQKHNLYTLIQRIGSELLIGSAQSHEALLKRVEVLRTLLHLAMTQTEKNPKLSVTGFLEFISRLEEYGTPIPVAIFGSERGVKVMTLHSSKGQEFDFVWIAHTDKASLAGSAHGGFALPEAIEGKVEKKDEEVQKRELYVAITRAKRFCTLSYALHSHVGRDLELASIVADLDGHFEKQSAEETESAIISAGVKHYVEDNSTEDPDLTLLELRQRVAKDYEDRKISVSLLNGFYECPWKWYFAGLLRIPTEQTESLVFGDIVHISIDRILKLAKIPTTKDIRQIVKDQITKSSYGNEEKQRIIERDAIAVVEEWTGKRLAKISDDRDNEKMISITDERFPHLGIYGKIDLIERMPSGEVRVTDFKTGTPRKRSDFEKMDKEGRMSDYMRQLAMYSYLLDQSSNGDIRVDESVLEFVQADPKDAFIRTNITKEHEELLVRDIRDYDELVKSGEWTERPCHFKSYGKQGAVCEYCKLKDQILK